MKDQDFEETLCIPSEASSIGQAGQAVRLGPGRARQIGSELWRGPSASRRCPNVPHSQTWFCLKHTLA